MDLKKKTQQETRISEQIFTRRQKNKHPEVLIMKEIDFEITNLEELKNEIEKASQLNEQLNQALENIKNFEPKIQVF